MVHLSFLLLCIPYKSSTYGVVDTFELLLCAGSPITCKPIALPVWKTMKPGFNLCMTYHIIHVSPSPSPIKISGCCSWAGNEYPCKSPTRAKFHSTKASSPGLPCSILPQVNELYRDKSRKQDVGLWNCHLETLHLYELTTWPLHRMLKGYA